MSYHRLNLAFTPRYGHLQAVIPFCEFLLLPKGGAPLGAKSITERAAEIGVSRGLLYKHIAAGRLKARKVGVALRIFDEDWLRYLDQLPVMGAATSPAKRRGRPPFKAAG
jgi:hypothetical protein